VSCAIDFNDKPCFSANEVGKIVTNWFLPDKFEIAKLAIAQFRPQPRFGIC